MTANRADGGNPEPAARVRLPALPNRGITPPDGCRAARANVAAVNYHFGGKQLYVAAWRHAIAQSVKAYPLDEGAVPPRRPPGVCAAMSNAGAPISGYPLLDMKIADREMLHPSETYYMK